MKRWLKYVKPYLRYFICGPILMIVEVVGEILMPIFFANIINNGVTNQSVGYIVLMGVLMIVAPHDHGRRRRRVFRREGFH